MQTRVYYNPHTDTRLVPVLIRKFCGLGLEDLLPSPRRCVALALASRSGRKTLNFWVGLWLITKGLNTINTILHTQAQEAAVWRWIWEWWTDRRRGITALCVALRGKKHRDGGPRGLASTSRTPPGQNFVALALKTPGLGLDHAVLEHIPGVNVNAALACILLQVGVRSGLNTFSVKCLTLISSCLKALVF